jgi:hypothetical protein
VGRDFPRWLELSFTKPENVANQDILTPKIIAVIPFGVQAMAEANGAFGKAGAQPIFFAWLKICQASLRLKGPFFARLGAGLSI